MKKYSRTIFIKYSSHRTLSIINLDWLKRAILLFFLFFIFMVVGKSQVTSVFINNDPTIKNAIEIRIYTPDYRNRDGINIYRKTDNSEWVLLTTNALMQKDSLTNTNLSKESSEIFKILQSNEPTNTSLISIIVALQLFKDRQLADALGLRFIDKNVEDGKTYQYKITNAKTKKVYQEKSFISGTYRALPPPDSIAVYQLNNKSIALSWLPNTKMFYGINIYKSTDNKEFQRLNEQIILLSKITNKDGVKEWPKINFVDDSLALNHQYRYRIQAMDYLGNEGQQSEQIIIDFKDKEAPAPPKKLFTTVIDKELSVNLRWISPKANDLAEYTMSIIQKGDTTTVLKTVIISKDSNHYSFKLQGAGKYQINMQAIDLAGNKSDTSICSFSIMDLLPPDPIQELNYTFGDSGMVVLRWKDNRPTDFMTYRVYRKAHTARHFVLINADNIDTAFFANQLAYNVKNAMDYYVVALDTNYNESISSDTLIVRLPDITPPSIPFLKTVKLLEDSIYIIWHKVTARDLAGYNLYLKTSDDTLKINKELIQGNTYKTTTPTILTNLSYMLTSVDSSNNESDYSNNYTLKENTQDTETGKFSKLKVKYKTESKNISLIWKYKGVAPMGYVVYYSYNGSRMKPISKMSNTNSTKYKSKGKGNYSFKVIAFYPDGSKVKSEIKIIQI